MQGQSRIFIASSTFVMLKSHIEKRTPIVTFRILLDELDEKDRTNALLFKCDGITLIQYAANFNNFELVELFFEYGANLFKNNTSIEVVKTFLENFTDEERIKFLNTPNIKHRTFLQSAIMGKNITAVRLLVDYGSDIFALPINGNSSFHLAICDVDILDVLIQVIKEQNLTIPIVITKVLYYAIFEKKFAALAKLLESDSPFLPFINVNVMNVTPLHIALGEGHTEAVKILLSKNVDLTKAAKNEVCPIHVAAAKGNVTNLLLLIDAFKLQIENIIKYNHKFATLSEYINVPTSEYAMYPHHYAAFKGNYEVLEVLLNMGLLPLNQKSGSSLTPLLYSVSEGHLHCTLALLHRNPDLHDTDKYDNNVFVYAGHKNRYFCGVYLINHININRSMYEKNILIDKKDYLTLSIIDTSKSIIIQVTKNPTFKQLMNDIKKIKEAVCRHATKVVDNIKFNDFISSVQWNKFNYLSLKYGGNGEIASGTGVLREYMLNAAKIILESEIFYTNNGGKTYDISYVIQPDKYLDNMRNIGTYLAIAVLTNPVPLPLKDYILKAITGEIICEEDILEPDMINHINMIHNLQPNQKEDLMIPFSTHVYRSQAEQHEIYFSGDKDALVTEETFNEFKNKLLYMHSYGGGRKELLNALADGFYQIIPKNFLRISDNIMLPAPCNLQLFNYIDLQDMIGTAPLNINEWKEYTHYDNCDKNTIQVIWFWEFVDGNTEIENRELYKFASGSSLLHLGGFKFLKDNKTPFTIKLMKNEKFKYPTSSTCNFTLNLPGSNDKDTLFDVLRLAIQNNNGFQLV